MDANLMALLRAVADMCGPTRACTLKLRDAFDAYLASHPTCLLDKEDAKFLALLRAAQIMCSDSSGIAWWVLDETFCDYIHTHKKEWDYLMSIDTTPCPKCGGKMEHIHGVGIDYDHLACTAKGCLGYVELSYSTFPADEEEGIPHAND